jgi:MFS family permease
VTALFTLDGFIFGSWAARVPDVANQVAASHAALGGALLCVSLGALATMQLTGALCTRLGTGLVSAGTAVLLCVAVVLPGLASSIPQLAAALLVFGGVTGMVNVAANSLGVRVEAARGRPLLPSLHAGFSFGGLAGALAGGLASSYLGLLPYLVTVAAAGLIVTAAVGPTLALADDRRSGPHVGREDRRTPGPRSVIVLLGAVAGCAAYGEGALADWGALHLREDLHAGPILAAAGYAGFSLAMACGRLGGGRLIHWFGHTPVLVAGTLLGAVGTLAAALAPVTAVALAGFVLVGLGLANVFPIAIARAGALGNTGGVALASTVGFAGLLGGPPVIGFFASHAGLPAALTTISALCVVAAVLALTVHGDRLSARFPDRARVRLEQFGTRVESFARRHARDLMILTDGGPQADTFR